MKVIRLCKGKGSKGTSHCVMAATSIVAGERFTDRPECVCPTITSALIRVNDRCPNDDIRNRLLGHLPWMIIGTRGDRHTMILRAKKFAAAAAAYAAAYAAAAADAADAAYAAADDAAAYAAYAADAAYAAYAADAARAAADAAAAYAAADAADDAAWEYEMKKFIDFIESEIIPIYTTMTVEPSFRIDKLVTVD